MSESFESILATGKPNSLGRTEEIVRIVLKDRRKMKRLFATLQSKDEWVRMRAGDALEKICREHPEWFKPYVERLLTEVAKIDQPSVQWHLAQMLGEMELTSDEYRRGKTILKRNLQRSDDWIILNVTMQQLFDWAHGDLTLRRWLAPELKRLSKDSRSSVKKRAVRLAAALTE